MKHKLLKSCLFLAFTLMTVTTGFSGYQIQDEGPQTTPGNVDENKGTGKDYHKVTFQNSATGKTTTRYYEDGYILSMADLADATSDDPNTMYVSGSKYLSWTIIQGNNIGQSLSSHIAITNDITLEGSATPYITANNIRLSAMSNNGFQDRSFESAALSTMESTYRETLNPGAEFVGQPDNILYLTEEAYSQNVSLELNAVSAEKDGGFLNLGVSLRSFKNGEYKSVTHVEQSENSGFALGQAVNIRLSKDSGDQNGYGRNDSSSQKKFVSYNADTTIGLSNPEANLTEGGSSEFQTPYKSQIDSESSGTYTYNATADSYSINYCANRIVLASDVIISGDITIGGITGYYGTNIDFSQSGFQGYINGSYCEVDLNGYDLILTSGHSLISYGSITDSSRFSQNSFSSAVDKGSLVMLPNSTLQSPFVLEDIFLPLSAPMSYYNANAPFNFYRCPYLDCETIFYAGSHFQGEFKVDLAGWSDETLAANGIVHFIGSTNNDENNLLLLNSGKIIRDVTYSDQFNSFSSNLFNQQINYLIEDADLTFSNWLINFQISSTSISFDSRRAQFFIPFYYQIQVHNSIVHLSTELVFMTGSHLDVDRDSTLILSYSSLFQTPENRYFDSQSYQSVGGLTFLDAFYYAPTSTTYYPLADAKNSDLLMSNANLWKTLDNTPAYCNFNGQIILQENIGVTQYRPFVFGGQMNISSMKSFQTEIKTWNQNKEHKKVRLFGNYFMLGPNTSENKSTPGSINYFYVRGFYTPPLMTRENKVLVDFTTTDHVVREDIKPGSSSGTDFVAGHPSATYDSDTGLITDGENTYAFIPDYSWSANWDNDNTSNFYGSTTLSPTKRNPDDLAGSFWKVTSHGNYISVEGQDYGQYVLSTDLLGNEKKSSKLTFNRPYNIFYRGSFVMADSINGSGATTKLYRYAGGDIENKDIRKQSYNMVFSNNTWSISGKVD